MPIYNSIIIKSGNLEELNSILVPDLNFKHPVVFNLKELSMDEQREIIGLVENFFVSHALSFKYPYPVYVLTDHEVTISNLSLIRNSNELPKFFRPKDGRMNVKEAHLASRNKLLQQEVRNCAHEDEALLVFGQIHRQISELENERLFYLNLLERLPRDQ